MRNYLSVLLLISLFASQIIFGQKAILNKQQSISDNVSYKKFNINNISTFIYNDGNTEGDPKNNPGTEFPKGSGKTVMYRSGLIWGAIVDNEIRVGGSTFNQGLQPRRIVENGLSEHINIYRVRRDYKDQSADFTSEMNDEEKPYEEIFAEYENDWINWPAELGAPYEDIDGNGEYNPNVDIPGVPGSDQTIWYVANDLDSNLTKNLYGSMPMGIEMQATFWGYNLNGYLGNTLFKKYKLVNKSENSYDSMFVAMWDDVDLGGAGDDFSGCDTTLNLMFTYNGHDEDEQYGDSPPALGHLLLRGPIRNNTDRLGMTSYNFFIGADPVYDLPSMGDDQNGAMENYSLFNGMNKNTNEPFIDYVTGKPTKFLLSGNPITGEGWIDGMLHMPGGRWALMSSGAFDMKPGYSQEIVFAEVIARGEDRLNSVVLLKENCKNLIEEYSELVADLSESKTLPDIFELHQNYPNPFNPTTKIKYTIPTLGTGHAPSLRTSIIVYNILGQIIDVLVEEYQTPGNYEIEFDGGNLSSGVYLYSLQYGEHRLTKKMMLLK